MSSEHCGTQAARIRGCIAGTALLAVLIVAGCAEKGPILLDVAYQNQAEAPAVKPVAGPKLSVAVSPFRDQRGKPASVLGERKIPDGQVDDFVVQGTVAEVATTALKQALAARNIAVKDAPAWDLTADTMNAAGPALLFGGEIKTLWLESTASTFKTHVIALVQLKVVVGDGAAKKLIRTVEVSSKLDQDVMYSKDALQSLLSEALTSAVEQVFQDEELKKLLQ